LASSGWDGKTRLLELRNGRELINISKSGDLQRFSPDDRKLVLGGWDQSLLQSFDVAEGVGLETIYERPDQPRGGGGSSAVSRNGRLVAYDTHDGSAVWDVALGRLVAASPCQGLSLVGFSAGDTELLFTGSKGLFRWPLHNKPSGHGPITGGPENLVSSECADIEGGRTGIVSADGGTCAIVGKNRCQLFRTDTFAKLAETDVQPGMRWGALSPDGSLLATGAWHAPGVKVWNARTGKLVKDLPADDGSRDTTATVAFSPDGRFLVTSIISEYCFWEVGSWNLARRVAQPTGNAYTAVMAFSPDGKVFAGRHSGNVIRLYDAATGAVLADLEAPNSAVLTSLSFNGTRLAAPESRDAFRVWDLRAIRQELAALGLDWEQPPYPSED
jgi:WD40 repeat protein